MHKRRLVYICLIGYSIVALYPFIWSLLGSFHSRIDVISGNIIFGQYTLDNFKEILLTDPLFVRWILNSVMIAIVGTTICVTLNTMAGYAISRIKFKGSALFLSIVLTVLVIPGQTLMIPNYLIIKNMGLLNTYTSLILPGAVSATYIYMMSQFFKDFPVEVEEAAVVDGLNRVQIFRRIAVPMARPAIMAQTLFIFISFWNSFQNALLYIQDESKYTLQLGLQSFQSANVSQWQLILAGAMISIIPVLIIYIVGNKYFMEGVTFGGTK